MILRCDWVREVSSSPIYSRFMADELPNPILSEPEVLEPIGEGAPVGISAPPGRRAAATFIFMTVTLDMLALGMIAPVLPRLIEGFLNGNTSSAAKMLGLFGT